MSQEEDLKYLVSNLIANDPNITVETMLGMFHRQGYEHVTEQMIETALATLRSE